VVVLKEEISKMLGVKVYTIVEVEVIEKMSTLVMLLVKESIPVVVVEKYFVIVPVNVSMTV
jgi:hypothetical protein